jgi:hypothetical protein
MKYEPMNEWMSHEFHIFYKFVCQECFQCTILMYERYELWINSFCMIFIPKSWNVKFIMGTLGSQSQPPMTNMCTSKKQSSYNFLRNSKIWNQKPTCTSRGSIILFTKSLIAITPREATCGATKGQAVKTQMLNECQVSQLIHA